MSDVFHVQTYRLIALQENWQRCDLFIRRDSQPRTYLSSGDELDALVSKNVPVAMIARSETFYAELPWSSLRYEAVRCAICPADFQCSYSC